MEDWREKQLQGDPPMPPWLVRQLHWWRYGSLWVGTASWILFTAPLLWIAATSPDADFFTPYGLVAGSLAHSYDAVLFTIGCVAGLVGSLAGILLAVLGLKALGSKSPPALYLGFAMSFALLILAVFLQGGPRGG